jgi:hypothetical protein
VRLQFLGDARDAFKWDFIHFLVTGANPAFRRLVFVPMLTPDDPGSTHGQLPASRYDCEPQIRVFMNRLREEPRTMARVAELGRLPGLPRFRVAVHAPSRFLGFGWERSAYWRSLVDRDMEGAVVLIDPDNGLEGRQQAGPLHIRCGELQRILDSSKPPPVVAVYQHRPYGESWGSVVDRAVSGKPPQIDLHVARDGSVGLLLFVLTSELRRIKEVTGRYWKQHPDLQMETR